MKDKPTITLPIEVWEKLANIIFQDMNFHNPHAIIIEARSFLLDLGITLTVSTPQKPDLNNHGK